jgi:hypothetical protein
MRVECCGRIAESRLSGAKRTKIIPSSPNRPTMPGLYLLYADDFFTQMEMLENFSFPI